MHGKTKLLWEIFITFLKIGPVTFGGGYAMIPLIEREVVTTKKWLKTEDVADVFAISESVPGAIGINSATFIGYRIAGVWGAVTAMIGILIPTFLIVIGLSISYLYFNDNPKVEAAFKGIRPAIVALITFAGYKIGQMAILDKTTFITAAVTIVILLSSPLHPAFMIIIGGFFGVILVKMKENLGYNVL
ncbi:chromate transporter [Pseudogracilibacillus auburnensis]|uniref:Chromate transporter n=1 Tax=Pseudogracilibacillus auburnensis TaxID=1494959 RepID=A0A2V3VJB4_9BACI|nr:chromate transporter [Pseudogracilibacillus auburnensis]PXW80971.1 chromate transporter [Pseudogracilibacillus auburnensis]